MASVEVRGRVDALRAVLREGAANQFDALVHLPDLGSRLRVAADRVLSVAAARGEDLGELTAWRRELELLLGGREPLEPAEALSPREHRPEALGRKPRAAELVGGIAQTSAEVRPVGRRLLKQRDEKVQRHLTRSYRAGLTVAPAARVCDQRYVKRSS